jgi:hypothetical protein
VSRLALASVWPRQSSDSSSLPSSPSVSAPAVYAGAFWTNSSTDVLIIGGNFSFFPTDSQSTSTNLAVYDPESSNVTALQGSQIDGTVYTLFVDGDSLYVGGDFTLSGVDGRGLAVYDLTNQRWDTSIAGMQSGSGASVLVRSVTKSASKSNTIVAAGTFSQAGSTTCQSVCLFDTSSKQWSQLGNGIQGEVSSVAYAGVRLASVCLYDLTHPLIGQSRNTSRRWCYCFTRRRECKCCPIQL